MRRIWRIALVGSVVLGLGVASHASAEPFSNAGAAILSASPNLKLSGEQVQVLRSKAEFAQPIQLKSEELAKIVNLRAAIGLEAEPEPDKVQSLLNGSSGSALVTIRTSDFANLTLSVVEAGKMLGRAKIQSLSFDANERATKAGSEFIESRIRVGEATGEFVIDFLLEKSSPVIESAVSQVFGEEYLGRVNFVIAPRSSAGVKADGEEVARSISELRLTDTGYWLDFWTGTVGISASHPETIEQIMEFAPNVKLGEFRIEGNSPSTLKSQYQPYGSVFAGLNVLGGPTCTTGFGVSTAYGNMLLTAGHCFSLNSTTYQGGQPLGPVVVRNYKIYYCCDQSTFDAELIASAYSGRATLGRIHVNDADWAHQISGWIGMNSDSVGAIICHSGVTTAGNDGYSNPYELCGPITQRNFSPNGYMYQPSPVFRVSTAQSRGGDSGGAFYWDSIFGSLGVGLMSGRTCGTEYCAANSILSHLPYIMNFWGITPLTN